MKTLLGANFSGYQAGRTGHPAGQLFTCTAFFSLFKKLHGVMFALLGRWSVECEGRAADRDRPAPGVPLPLSLCLPHSQAAGQPTQHTFKPTLLIISVPEPPGAGIFWPKTVWRSGFSLDEKEKI